MKVLYILNDGPKALASRMMEAQSKDNELEVIDLSKDEVSYETVIDSISTGAGGTSSETGSSKLVA